jgi:hypothetical protein
VAPVLFKDMANAVKAWVVLGLIEEPLEEMTYLVGADSAGEAKKLFQEHMGGNHADVFVAELDQNAIGVLRIEPGELRFWGVGGQSPPDVDE